jgi:hypothetical protein
MSKFTQTVSLETLAKEKLSERTRSAIEEICEGTDDPKLDKVGRPMAQITIVARRVHYEIKGNISRRRALVILFIFGGIVYLDMDNILRHMSALWKLIP